MKKFIRHIILYSLPFLTGIIILFLVPVNKKFSYNFIQGECDNKASWIYNKIVNTKQNIDIVFIGASHTTCGIMDNVIENEINKTSKQEINVANFGFCRGGRDIQYLFLKDLFKKHQPKLLFVEVMEDEPKKSHPVFAYLADTHELLASLVWFNQRFVSGLWKGLLVRFEFVKHQLFSEELNSRASFSNTGYIPSKQTANETDLATNQKAWEKRLAHKTPGILRKSELNYSKHYLKKIISLADKNHCEVVFLYLPEWGSKLEKPLLYKYYRSISEVILPGKNILKDKNNWKDAGHFNDYGAKQITRQLTDYLKRNFDK